MDAEIYKRYRERRNAKETLEERAARKAKAKEYNRKRYLRLQAAKPPKVKKSKEERLADQREKNKIYMRNKRATARAEMPPRPPKMTRKEISRRYLVKRKANETLEQREERLRAHRNEEAARRKANHDAMTQEELEADRLATNRRLREVYAKKTPEERKARKRSMPTLDQAKKYTAKWKSKEPEHAKAVSRKNSHRRRALKAGNTEAEMLTDAGRMMKFILMAPASACAYCDKIVSGKEREFDHIIPLCLGGSHSPLNLIACCRSCNARKWRNEIGEAFHAANGKTKDEVLKEALAQYRAWKKQDTEMKVKV